MTLPPDLALAYLKALSADVRDAVIQTADGQLVAGDPALLQRAHDHVFAEADDQHAITVVTGPHALPALVRMDLRSVLADLRTR